MKSTALYQVVLLLSGTVLWRLLYSASTTPGNGITGLAQGQKVYMNSSQVKENKGNMQEQEN